MMIDLNPHHLDTVRAILAEHVPDCEVMAFGSRAAWTAHERSDLDLAVACGDAPPDGAIARLREAFEDSDLPVRVDVLDWHTIADGFRETIAPGCVVIQQAGVPKGWRDITLGDIAEIVGGGTPSTRDHANFDGDVPWLTPKDLAGQHERYVSSGARNLSQQGFASCSARLVPPSTVLLSTRAPIGYVAIAKNPITTNQGFRNLILHDDVSSEYIYYWLLLNTEELDRHASGSTFRELSGSALKKIGLRLPPIDEQRRIARVLGALDERIEANWRASAALEDMARTLFRHWFVDFGPVRAKAAGESSGLPPDLDALFPASFESTALGEAPAGWKWAPLREAIDVNPARRLRRGDMAPYVNLAAITPYGPGLGVVSAYRPYTSGSRYRAGDTLMGRMAHSIERSKVALVDFLDGEQVGWGSTEFIVLRPKQPWPPVFAYLLAGTAEFREHAAANVTGTTRQRVPAAAIESYMLTRPPDDLAVAFGSIVQPWVTQASRMTAQSRTLATLRDTLLPRLLSGEVRLST